MVRLPGLTPATESISLWQRLLGGLLAGSWSQSADPPIGPNQAGYYAAALGILPHGPGRDRVARCLLYCDVDMQQYCLKRLDIYREAMEAYPTDDRTVFFVGSLCQRGIYTDKQFTERVYALLLQPQWAKSSFWTRFDLPQRQVLSTLASFFAEDTETITPDRVELIENALEKCDDRSPERISLTTYLARAYRGAGRMDETAEIVYRFVFMNQADDTENNLFLARLYQQRQRMDGNACAVFARLVAQSEAQGNATEADHWTVRLARAYIGIGRLDEGTISTLRKAAEGRPDDLELRGAYLCALVRRGTGFNTPEMVARLEQAVEDEKELNPVFVAHRWDWGLVPRALSLAYGEQKRSDSDALTIYARAAELCPEDRSVWRAYGRALSLRDDHSEASVEIYEKAVRGSDTDEEVLRSLARAYVETNAYDGPKRPQALQLWETLYRQGYHWPEMVQALARAYVGEDRVNDIALALWEQAIQDDEKNGLLRLRLAQEWKMRGDVEAAARLYREAAKLLPKDFAAQYEAGALLSEHFSDHVTAIRLLQKAVKLPPGQKHLHAHFALGESLLARDKREEAKAVFQKIVDEIDQTHTRTLLNLAKLNLKYEEAGVQRAEALYEQALTLDPDHPETYRKMAELYREKGQSEDEEQALEKYLALSSPDADKYRQLADLYIRRGDFIKAETALRHVITLGKADRKLYTLLGEVLVQARAMAA